MHALALTCSHSSRLHTMSVQMAECRGQMLKEQKARHALMLRKERLEAEVIRLRGLQAGEAGSRQAQAYASLFPTLILMRLPQCVSVSVRRVGCQRLGR